MPCSPLRRAVLWAALSASSLSFAAEHGGDAPAEEPAPPPPAPAPPPPAADAPPPAADAPPADAPPADAPAAPAAPAAPPAPPAAASAPPADTAALQGQIDALQYQLELLRMEIAEDRKALTPPSASGRGMKIPSSFGTPAGFHLDLSGYFRTRGFVFGAKLGAEKPVTGGIYDDQTTSGRYMNMRLRTGLRFAWKDTAALNIHLQALDNVVWGDNAGLSSVALFGEEPSFTGPSGQEAPPIQIFRAWGEVKTMLGVVRVGRQSSHWGMGLLANHGDGFDDDFGENYYGNQFDRFLFGTNPVSLIQAFTKKVETKEIPLTLAIAVDRLVEDPLVQYYGYQCRSGIRQDTNPEGYDVRCDVDGDGLTDLEHDFTEDRDAADRPEDWWADQNDDVWEMVYALIYKGQKLDYLAGGNLSLGGYLIHRVQRETDSQVLVADLYFDLLVKGFGAQFEGVGIFGKTKALPLPDYENPDDPLAKKARIFGYAARVFYEQPKWRVLFESGFASGDGQANDPTFTGRALHPDYNVGLLLYEEVLSRVTANLWGESARGLRSKGGVYDSHYLFPRVYGMPLPGLTLIGGVLLAFPDTPDGAIIRCNDRDIDRYGCAVADATRSMLGQEVDFAVKYQWADHLNLSIETGYAHVSDRVALAAAGLKANDKNFGNFWTLQGRLAWEF